MLATIILGCGYMVRDRDFYESRASIKENKVLNLSYEDLDCLVEKFNIENLKITPIKDNEYSYKAKTGNFKEISGTFKKLDNKQKSIAGTCVEKNLLSEKKYLFELNHHFNEIKKDFNWFTLNLSPADNPSKVEEYSIFHNKKFNRLHVNGMELETQEQKDGKTFGLILLAVAIASLAYMAGEDVSKD